MFDRRIFIRLRLPTVCRSRGLVVVDGGDGQAEDDRVMVGVRGAEGVVVVRGAGVRPA